MHYREIDINFLRRLVSVAGEEVMKIYQTDFSVERKEDRSPLTEADRKANAVLISGLTATYPDIPVISEENKVTDYDTRKQWQRCWLIDPIDGTREFIKKNGEFTINVALVEHQKTVLGIVYAPAKHVMYVGAKGHGAYKTDTDGNLYQIGTIAPERYTAKSKVIVVASRSHLTPLTLDFVKQLEEQGKEVAFLSSGSSLKFCLVAEGLADVYPRFGPTMEWDTAAAHAVAACAGRKVVNAQTGEELNYNKQDLLNPHFIVS